jgi:hypothetical protein
MDYNDFTYRVNKAYSQANIDMNYAVYQNNLNELIDDNVIVLFNVAFDKKDNFKKITNGTWNNIEKKWCIKCKADFLFTDKMLNYVSIFNIYSIKDDNNILTEDKGYSTCIEVLEGLKSYFEPNKLDEYLDKEEKRKNEYMEKRRKNL